MWRGEDLAPLERRLTNDRTVQFNKIVTRHGVEPGNTPAVQAGSTPLSPELLELIEEYPPTVIDLGD